MISKEGSCAKNEPPSLATACHVVFHPSMNVADLST